MEEILIADDEKIVRTPLRMALEKANYSVTEATNGVEILDILNSKHIDLLILDMAMPEKSGMETLMDIQKGHANLKIVVMTGAIDIHQKTFSRFVKQYHIKDVLEKPFDLELFLAVVKKALRN